MVEVLVFIGGIYIFFLGREGMFFCFLILRVGRGSSGGWELGSEKWGD